RFLRKRASVGVEPGVIGGGEIEYIARCSDSDARDAIALLSHSVRNTANGSAERVTWAVINDSKPDADQAVVRSRLSNLSRDQRLVLEVTSN
ncbi:orc1/cdc6 family replication initiation protein, partial [Natrinema soli]